LRPEAGPVRAVRTGGSAGAGRLCGEAYEPDDDRYPLAPVCSVGDLAWDTYASPALPTEAEKRERERIVTQRVNALARLRALQRGRK
jgi:hypothetical protein